MYFSNITNEELQFFHGLKVPNFSISLTDILTSNLFKKETIIADSIYKIYPLFYCNEINSTNPEDKILETRCIICKKETKETYLTFISDEGDVQDYINYANYFDVGDTLTVNQYNQIVSLLRSNVIMNDKIKINEAYIGSYGKYLFDITGATIIDLGMVITDETITAEPKVMLKDNQLHYAKYTLELKVLHYTGAKVEDDDDSDYTVIDTLEIVLTPNVWVDIPVNNLEEDYIICLNAEVQITFDTPVIQDWINSLSIIAEPDIIQTGDYSEIYATGYDIGGLLVGSGHTIYFFEKYIPNSLKITGDKSIIQTSDTMDLTAKLKDIDGSIVTDVIVYFFEQYVVGKVDLTANKNITQTGDTVNFSAKVRDKDGSIVIDDTVRFFKETDDTGWNLTLTDVDKDIIQKGEVNKLTVNVKNSSNQNVENVLVDFYYMDGD